MWLSRRKIHFDIALGIHDYPLAFGDQHVGRMRQAAQVKLFEIHDRSSPARNARTSFQLLLCLSGATGEE